MYFRYCCWCSVCPKHWRTLHSDVIEDIRFHERHTRNNAVSVMFGIDSVEVIIFYFFLRLNEIMNASKTISKPIINAYLNVSNDKEFARVVKMRIEKTTLGQVM